MALTGLSQFKESNEKRFVKSEPVYFKAKPGESYKIRPLSELDISGLGYDPKLNNVANFVEEHQNPIKFWLKIKHPAPDAADTRCVGCEMVQKFGFYMQTNANPEKNQHGDPKKNWNKYKRFYLPVLVDRQDGSEATVEVMQFSFGQKAASAPLIDFFDAKNTITDRWWTYSRNDGMGRETKYSFVPDDPSDLDLSKYELPDIGSAPYVQDLPYEQQREHLQIEATYYGGRSDTNSFDDEVSHAEPVARPAQPAVEDW